MKPIKLKGQSVQAWEDWLKNELAEPNDLSDPNLYVLNAFLELLQKYRELVEV